MTRIKSTLSSTCFRYIVLAGIMAVLPVITTAQSSEDQGPILSSPLDGAWHSDISSVPPGFSFRALLIFTPGPRGIRGAMFETDDTAFSPTSGLAGPGVGAWVRIGDHQFAFTFKVHAYDSSGNLIGLETVSAALALDQDGDTFTGRSHYKIVSPTGGEISSGDSTFTARRIQVEPLPPTN
ncbi:MAG: hypothetical protein M3Y72_19345 [Acidobacteriota bacterium]|nr:hypothetical protein [Acidobacteriota bacterium]